MRILTVGLNPSLLEFPTEDPFSRFPLADGAAGREPDRYLDALSAYYRTEPYRSWFSAFEPLLNGAGASYYAGETSTALHTDICSPVATSPTWSKLHETERAILETEGEPLWHGLLEAMQPHIVALSVKKLHLERINFLPLTDEWEAIHTFDRKADGSPRPRPYKVERRWYGVGGEPSMFLFGQAGRTPLTISNEQKREMGERAREVHHGGQ